MDDIDARVEALLAAPVGCAFLLAVRESRMTPTQAAEPRATFALGATAVNMTEIWNAGHEEDVARILELGKNLGSLAQAVLQEPGASWWFEPADRRRQVYVWRPNGTAPSAAAIGPSIGSAGEPYYRQLWTSTVVGGEACMRTFIDNNAGEWSTGGYPLRQWMLSAEPGARVYEVTDADSWHELCLRYPERRAPNVQFREQWPDRDWLTVDWPAAARDWDGVHITFGALLIAEQVSHRTAEGWSAMWGWESEITIWLRWVFDKVERLPDHERIENDPHVAFPYDMIWTKPSRSTRYLGPPSPLNAAAQADPPLEPPRVRVLVFDGGGHAEQQGALHHVQWATGDIPERLGDGRPDWPRPVEARAGMRAAVRFEAPTPPNTVEVRTFDRFGADGGFARPISHTRCETSHLFGDLPCNASRVERDGSLGWEVELRIPEAPGRYYFAVWTEWFGNPKPGRGWTSSATWLFAIDRV